MGLAVTHLLAACAVKKVSALPALSESSKSSQFYWVTYGNPPEGENLCSQMRFSGRESLKSDVLEETADPQALEALVALYENAALYQCQPMPPRAYALQDTLPKN